MKEIPLTKGKVAIVDDEDYLWVSKFKWYAADKRGSFYACRGVWNPVTKKNTTIYLHREIMKPAPEEEVDHKFGNTLDNRRSEMRNVTNSQNKHAFRRIKKDSSSKFRGVAWSKGRGKWQAGIVKGDRRIALGRFVSEEEAARAYDKAALELFGEFAQPNFPV